MDSNKINNNPAIAEKLFTEIFVNNNLKNEHPNQSKRKGLFDHHNLHHQYTNGSVFTSGASAITSSSSSSTLSTAAASAAAANKFESNIKYVSTSNSYVQQQEIRTDSDVNILIYTNRPDNNFDCQKKLTFHDVLISELTENQRNYNTNEYQKPNPNSKLFDKENNTYSSSCTINVSDWQSTDYNQKKHVYTNVRNLNLNSDSMKRGGFSGGNNSDIVNSGGQGVQNRLSFPGLPPLPQSLSGMEINVLNSTNNTINQNDRTDKDSRSISLDNHLAILKREMFGLRQLDLSLLSQLWALNESIQEYRMISQEQENFTIQSSSPSPSETVSLSSTEDSNVATPEDNVYNGRKKVMPKVQPRMQTAPPPPPISSSTSSSSSSRAQNRNIM